jgi:hypothetical protein
LNSCQVRLTWPGGKPVPSTSTVLPVVATPGVTRSAGAAQLTFTDVWARGGTARATCSTASTGELPHGRPVDGTDVLNAPPASVAVVVTDPSAVVRSTGTPGSKPAPVRVTVAGIEARFSVAGVACSVGQVTRSGAAAVRPSCTAVSTWSPQGRPAELKVPFSAPAGSATASRTLAPSSSTLTGPGANCPPVTVNGRVPGCRRRGSASPSRWAAGGEGRTAQDDDGVARLDLPATALSVSVTVPQRAPLSLAFPV